VSYSLPPAASIAAVAQKIADPDELLQVLASETGLDGAFEVRVSRRLAPGCDAGGAPVG
jgi:hypothetical protein